MIEKTWHDYIDQARYLIDRNMSDMDEIELAKKLFLINSSGREEEAATSSSPKHN